MDGICYVLNTRSVLARSMPMHSLSPYHVHPMFSVLFSLLISIFYLDVLQDGPALL